MRPEVLKRLFLNYSTLYKEFGTMEYYREMKRYYQMLIDAIRNQIKATT